jgi:hypothetical protein
MARLDAVEHSSKRQWPQPKSEPSPVPDVSGFLGGPPFLDADDDPAEARRSETLIKDSPSRAIVAVLELANRRYRQGRASAAHVLAMSGQWGHQHARETT